MCVHTQQPTQPTNLARCLARRPPCAWRRPAALPKVLFMPSSSLPAVSISTAAARLYTLTRPPMPLSVGCIMSSVVERPAVDMVAECAVCLSVMEKFVGFGSKSKSIKIVCVCVCTCDCVWYITLLLVYTAGESTVHPSSLLLPRLRLRTDESLATAISSGPPCDASLAPLPMGEWGSQSRRRPRHQRSQPRKRAPARIAPAATKPALVTAPACGGKNSRW